jgi:hypothetical protein
MGKQQLEILTDMADSMVVGNQLLEQVAEQLESISEQMQQPVPHVPNCWHEVLTEHRAYQIDMVGGGEVKNGTYEDDDVKEEFIVVVDNGWKVLIPYTSIKRIVLE